MPVKVKLHDNTSTVKVASGCGITDARLEYLIKELQRTKQDLGFISLDEYLDASGLGGTLPENKLNLLIRYLIDKVSVNGHVYHLSSAQENTLYYVCQDLDVDYNQVEVNKLNRAFGLGFSILDHSKLSNLDYLHSGHTGFAGIEFGTTAYWQSKPSYVPPKGMLVIYTDKYEDEQGNPIPGFKIGDGNAYVGDAPFVGDDTREALEEHITDTVVHITAEEREKWNNKLNFVAPESGSDLLVFNRD